MASALAITAYRNADCCCPPLIGYAFSLSLPKVSNSMNLVVYLDFDGRNLLLVTMRV